MTAAIASQPTGACTRKGNAVLWGRSCGFWAVALILAVTAVRLWFIASNQVDLVQDEAQYWDWSRRPQLSYFTKGPLIAWIIGAGTALFGDTDFGVRIGAVAGSTLVQAVMYLGLARGMGRPRLGLAALAVANTSVLVMVSGIMMTTDNPLMVCWTGGLFCLYLALRNPRKAWPFAGLAVCVAVGILAKYMMLAMAGVALAYWWGLKRNRALSGGTGRLFAALAVGAAVGLAPILIWNFNNGFAGFMHVSHLAGVAGKGASDLIRFDRIGPYLGSQVGLATPWWLFFALWGAWRALRQGWNWTPADRAGTGLEPDQAWLLACGFWPVWGYFMVWSLHTKIMPNWPAVSYAAGLILAASAWKSLADRRGPRDWRVAAWPLAGLLIFAACHVHDYLSLPLRVDARVPAIGRVAFENPALRLKGWEDLGAELTRLHREFPDPDKVFFFAGNYDMTAALAYYGPGRPRAYCINTGRRLNQYDLWEGPDGHRGWDALYVRQKFHTVAEPGIEGLFERLERIEYQTMHKGREARRFTIFKCYGYKGPWPGLEKGTGY